MNQPNYPISKIITLNFNQNNYQFDTELIKPLGTFYNEVCSYFQINPNNFSLYYNNKKLPTSNTNQNFFTLSSIIGNNDDGYFQIVPKKSKTPNKLNLRYESNSTKELNPFSSNKKFPKNFLTLSTNIPKSNILNNGFNNSINGGIPAVIISQIPSVNDIKDIINNFNNNQNNINNKGVLSILGDNSVRVDFQDEKILNEFISYITFMKYQNNYFKNIIIQKDTSIIRKKIRNLSHSNKNVSNLLHHFNHKYNYNSINTPRNDHKVDIRINDVIKALKQNELNHDCYHGLSLNRDGEDEIVTDYYKQQDFIRNSSPYINENEIRILEEKENKKLFFDKHKNFVTSVGKYSMKPNFIPNYVGMTPSENPKTHVFRDVDKKKWITNKGFNV